MEEVFVLVLEYTLALLPILPSLSSFVREFGKLYLLFGAITHPRLYKVPSCALWRFLRD